MLHLGYERICYVWVMEGQVTFGLQKDMLLLDYGRTCYIWVTEGQVTFGLKKDMLLLDYGRTCYIWVTEGHVTFGVQKDVLHPEILVIHISLQQNLLQSMWPFKAKHLMFQSIS